MKIRRLSEIDLARLTAISAQEQLEQELRLYNAGGGRWSYDPVRQSTADILEAKTPLLGETPSILWSMVSEQISRACNKGKTQRDSNLGVGQTLYESARRLRWSAAKVDMGRLSIGFGESVRYWSDVVIEDQNGLFVPFFDHRRSRGVSNAAVRQVIFSMQHLWVRERIIDLAEARLAVIRFPSSQDARGIQIDFHSEADLMSYDDLNERVRNVYQTWARVSEERRGGEQTGTGGSNSLGF